MLELQLVSGFKGLWNLKLTRTYQNNADVSFAYLVKMFFKYLEYSFPYVYFSTLGEPLVGMIVRLHRFQASR
jgi:hypothetical protein